MQIRQATHRGRPGAVTQLTTEAQEQYHPCLDDIRAPLLSIINYWWRRGVTVERRTRDREVVGSSLDRALRRKNSGQVSHTYG